MPGLANPKQQGQSQGPGQGQGVGLVQEVQLRGAKRTQELIRQNQKLPEADKGAVAEAERAKGNEFFRCVQGARCAVCCASTTCTVGRSTQHTREGTGLEVTGCGVGLCCAISQRHTPLVGFCVLDQYSSLPLRLEPFLMPSSMHTAAPVCSVCHIQVWPHCRRG